MFDIAALSSALASLKVIVDLTKGITNAQISAKVVTEVSDIQMKLLTVQQQAMELQQQNYQLQEEKRALKTQLEEKQSAVFLHGVWWLTSSCFDEQQSEIEGKEIHNTIYDGPYCPLCKELNQKFVHLKPNGQTAPDDKFVYFCEVHKTDYEAPIMSR